MKRIVLCCWTCTCWFQVTKENEQIKKLIDDNNVELLSKHYVLENEGIIEKETYELHPISKINYFLDFDEDVIIKTDLNNKINVDNYYSQFIPTSAGYFSVFDNKKEEIEFVIPGDDSDFSPNDLKLISTSFGGFDITPADVISYKGNLIKAEPRNTMGGWFTQRDGYVMSVGDNLNLIINWPKL